MDLGILDVMQIFGRAGRPQFDKFGEGTIITNHDKLSHYLSLMTRQQPIESQLLGGLNDNLNAEVRGSSVAQAIQTYQGNFRRHTNQCTFKNFAQPRTEPCLAFL